MSRRNWIFLAVLGGFLMSLALIVRFGVINFDRSEDRDREMAIAQAYPRTFKTISGLHFVVDRPGAGDTPYPGSVVRFSYTLSLFGSDQVLESSETQGGSVRARVGQPPMLKGFTEALLGMRVGERRTIILPPHLAFGQVGQAPAIPPKATLVYVVDLLEVEPVEKPAS
jgi:peptidylprolyl isomerase